MSHYNRKATGLLVRNTDSLKKLLSATHSNRLSYAILFKALCVTWRDYVCSVSQVSQTSQNLKIVQFWFLHEGNRTCCTYCGRDPLKKIKNIFKN